MSKNFFVTGIGTDVGKTVGAAVLVQALKANYWKPIQAGNLEFTDSDFIRQNTDYGKLVMDESVLLSTPASPNIAAKFESKEIDVQRIEIPYVINNFIVEGAGGIMVPINDKHSMLDLINKIQFPVILCVKSYLGCINHFLLTVEVLKLNKIPISGIILSGTFDSEVKETILSFTDLPLIVHIPFTDNLSSEFIREQAEHINLDLL